MKINIIEKASIQPITNDARISSKSVLWGVYDVTNGNTISSYLVRAYGMDIDKDTQSELKLKNIKAAYFPLRAALIAFAFGKKVTALVLRALSYAPALEAFLKTETASGEYSQAVASLRIAEKKAENALMLVNALWGSIPKESPISYADVLEAEKAIKSGTATEEQRKTAAAAAELIAKHCPVSNDGGNAFNTARETLMAALKEIDLAEAKKAAAAAILKDARTQEKEAAAAFNRRLVNGGFQPLTDAEKAAAADTAAGLLTIVKKSQKGK